MASGSCWIAADPHRGAYDALASDKPRRPGQATAAEIMKRLGSATPATEDARCLACHTNPTLAEPGHTEDARVLALRREGVSCEACHGNAGGWLREHTTGRTSGMRPLAEMAGRAAACAGCHLGAPAGDGHPVRDMNHDMIAAGHPRLNFDFAEYHRRLPKHWREPTPVNPAREWLLGRVVHAEAACRLLADRAERSKNDPRSPWPEFAEFRCASCHHRFADPNYAAATPGGSAKWQSLWPVTVMPAAGRAELDGHLRVMGAGRVPAERLIEPARKAASGYAELRESLASLPDAELTNRARRVFPPELPPAADTDTVGQVLLGLSAMQRGKDDAVFSRAFEQYRRRDWPGVRTSLDLLLKRIER
jgi:hypothetical protein